jgi:hypothetical protein
VKRLGVDLIVGLGVHVAEGVGVELTVGVGVDVAKGRGAANGSRAAFRGDDPDCDAARSGEAARSWATAVDDPAECVAAVPLLTARPAIPVREAATTSPATADLFPRRARIPGSGEVSRPGVVHWWPSQ